MASTSDRGGREHRRDRRRSARADALLRRRARSIVDTLCSPPTPADDHHAVRRASSVPGYGARSRTRDAVQVRDRNGPGARHSTRIAGGSCGSGPELTGLVARAPHMRCIFTCGLAIRTSGASRGRDRRGSWARGSRLARRGGRPPTFRRRRASAGAESMELRRCVGTERDVSHSVSVSSGGDPDPSTKPGVRRRSLDSTR